MYYFTILKNEISMLCFSKGILAGGKAHKESSIQCALQGCKTTIFHNSNAIKPAA